jgi:hypothetical protein
MQAMAAKPKHWTANLLQIYKRNTNFQISTETAAIACMLLLADAASWYAMEFNFIIKSTKNNQFYKTLAVFYIVV